MRCATNGESEIYSWLQEVRGLPTPLAPLTPASSTIAHRHIACHTAASSMVCVATVCVTSAWPAARDHTEVPEERGCGSETVEPHRGAQAARPPPSQGLVLQLLCQCPAWRLIPEVIIIIMEIPEVIIIIMEICKVPTPWLKVLNRHNA